MASKSGSGGGGRSLSLSQLRVGDRIVTRVYGRPDFAAITKVNRTSVNVTMSGAQSGRFSLDTLLEDNPVTNRRILRNGREFRIRG